MSKQLIKSGLVVSSMTFLSRLLGMLRDMVIANVVGARIGADVFLFANRIPNFFRRLFAEGAFTQAFVPILTMQQHCSDQKEVRVLLQRVFGTFGGIITLFTLFGIIFSPLLTAIFAFGWYLDWLHGGVGAIKFTLASCLIRITFPYLWFISFVAFSGAILNTLGQFGVAAFSPVLLNISMIGCAFWIAPQVSQPEIALAIGVFIGGLLQFFFQIPFLWRAGLLVRPRWCWRDAYIIKIRKLMLPAILGVSINQINVLLNSIIASFMITGSISWLYYADRILEFPVGLVGVTLSTILLPTLARYYNNHTQDQFFNIVDWGIKIVFLFSIPATLGLYRLAKPIVLILYLRGAFAIADWHATSAALQILNIGLLGIVLSKVLSCVYYARQDIKTPVRCGVLTIVSQLLLNSLAWKWGYIGLATTCAVANIINAGLLYSGLVRFKLYKVSWISFLFILRVILASIGMTVLLVYLVPENDLWLSATQAIRCMWLLGLLTSACICYIFLLFLLGIRWHHLHTGASS